MSHGVHLIIKVKMGNVYRYLFTNRKDHKGKYPAGAYDLPGGQVDESDESDIDALRRELLEELFLNVDGYINSGDLSFLGEFRGKQSRENLYMLELPIDLVNKMVLLLDHRESAWFSNEKSGLRWLSIDEIKNLDRWDMFALYRDILTYAEGGGNYVGVDKDFYADKMPEGYMQFRYGRVRESAEVNHIDTLSKLS